MKRSEENFKIFHYGHKSKSPIVLVHGFPYDHMMWKNQIQFLQDDYHIVTYDIRGLGESRTTDCHVTMELLVDDLFHVIEKNKLDKPVLCGLSMGGYISFRAVEKDESKFKALIIVDSKPEADNNAARLKRANGIKTIDNEGLEKFLKETMPRTFAKSTLENSPEIYNEVYERAKTFDPHGVKGAMFAMLSRTSTVNNLKKIKIPTLFLVGESDQLTTPEAVKKTCDKVKNSTLEIVPDAGHMTPLENPKFVNNQIRKFLNRL